MLSAAVHLMIDNSSQPSDAPVVRPIVITDAAVNHLPLKDE